MTSKTKGSRGSVKSRKDAKKWMDFLCNSKNKEKLFTLLTEAVYSKGVVILQGR